MDGELGKEGAIGDINSDRCRGRHRRGVTGNDRAGCEYMKRDKEEGAPPIHETMNDLVIPEQSLLYSARSFTLSLSVGGSVGRSSVNATPQSR